MQALDAVRRGVDAIPDLMGRGSGIGSNSWVVSGEHTVSGKPLLANDPHLDASIPGIWYQMGLHCRSVDADCPFDVSGFTFSGVPGVVIGHNRDIAWGMTNLDPDVTDLYLEKVTGKTYLYGGKQVPLTERDEVIRIAGESSRLITVRSTRHGPLLSDVSAELSSVGANAEVPADAPPRENGYGVALAWTALTPRPTADAIFDARPGVELAGVPRGGPELRRTQPEPRVRRHRRQHRLPGAGSDPDPPGRSHGRLPGGGLAAAERLERPLRAVRRAADGLQPCRGLRGHRQPGRDGSGLRPTT